MSDTDQYTDVPVEPTPEQGGRRMPRWVIYTVLGVILLVVLFYGAIFLYAKVINDSPDEFTAADIDAALSAEAADDGTAPVATASTPQDTVATGQPPVAPSTAPTATAEAAPVTTAAPQSAASSQWVATDASQVGYRVQEILFGVDTTAVGRTNQVDGTLTIGGAQVTGVDFTVDVASITSDESRRDSA